MSDESAYTKDSLQNLVTNLGTGQDKGTASTFVRRHLSEEVLNALYRFGGIGGKIVDVVPLDATRKWRSATIPKALDRAKFDNFEKALGVRTAFNTAAKWGRLHGGGVVLIEVEGDDPAEPLVESTISPNKPITALHVRSRWDLGFEALDLVTMRQTLYADFRVSNDKYHPSRVLGPFEGVHLPRSEQEKNHGWGGSIIERCFDALLNDGATAAQISPLIHEALVKLLGVKDLAKYLKNDENQRMFERRIAMANFLASSQNTYVYDVDKEKPDRFSSVAALTGLGDLLEKNANRVASIVDIPMTRLYGQVTGGLNTSAATNLKDYYNTISSFQTDELGPHLDKLDRLLLRSVYGTVPDKYWYEWNPLDEPTSEEKAKTEEMKGRTDTAAITAGVIVPAQAARRIQKDGPYELTDEYVEALEERDGLRQGTPEITAGVAGEVQAQALNGAQISALVDIAAKVRSGELDPEQAQELMMLAVPALDPEKAKRIAGTKGPEKPVTPQPPAPNALEQV